MKSLLYPALKAAKYLVLIIDHLPQSDAQHKPAFDDHLKQVEVYVQASAVSTALAWTVLVQAGVVCSRYTRANHLSTPQAPHPSTHPMAALGRQTGCVEGCG